MIATTPENPIGGRWRRPVALAAGMVVLLWANYYLRHSLEESPKRMYSFLEYFYKPQIPIVFGQLPVWRLFLPLQEFTGGWVTSTLILTYVVERVLTPAGAWELFNAVAIVAAFATTWFVYRSAVFSFTTAICVGFGTQFYHAYAVSGGIASYLLITYHMLLLGTATLVVRGDRPAWAWRLALAFSVFVNVIGYEGWLDVLVLVWLATPFAAAVLWRMDRRDVVRRLMATTAVLTAVGVVYVLVKVTLGYGQTNGSESDIILNYRSFWPAFDDLVSNVFTHTFLSVSNFLPPVLVGGSAFASVGADALLEAQHQYHEPFNYLVVMNQVFLWRFYAGAVFLAVLFALWRTGAAAWKRPSASAISVGVFLIMLVAGGPTHALIKFRPMNSEPVMTYHVTVGVIGASLLIAWALTAAWTRMSNRRAAAAVVAAGWLVVFYGALARPPYLSHMAAQAGLGDGLYPNPLQTLAGRWGFRYTPLEGTSAYRLRPYRSDLDPIYITPKLADLPSKLPPPSEWSVAAGHPTVTPIPDGIELLGDDSQSGYQLISAPIAIQRATPYLFRVRLDTIAGRVCGGVLSSDQQRWLVSPDGATAEYAFDSGNETAVRVVLANCYAQPNGNPKTHVRVFRGSYAAFMPPSP